jgi:tripartite ATP-independent transporter DctP family solute receptor
MKLKQIFMLLLVVLMTTVIVACSGNNEETGGNENVSTENNGENNSEAQGVEDGEVFTLQAGHSLPSDHPYELAFLEMAENVEERTNGQVIIETFPDSQIGAERELTEGLTLGTVDLVVSSTAPVTNFIPELGVLDLPFLFNDRDSAVEVLESDIGDGLLAGLEDQGILGLSWAENGFRHITNSVHPIESPEDLKGLSIRTQENEIHLAAFEELGASPSPMAWTEALTALQQGVVDGQENPAIVADQFNLYDANQEFMSLTGHVYSVAIFMMSMDTYESLPTEYQEIILEEGQRIGAVQRELIIEMEQESLQNLRDQGMQLIEDVNITPFRDGISGVYESFEHQEILAEILEAQE